jgi:glycosyltransferase involved in cell wall biosynthesis
MRWVSGVIANSQAVRQHNATRLRVPFEKVHVIYRGRDPEAWANPDNKAQAHLFRTRYMRDPGGSLLVNVARLIPRKGQSELFQAIARLLPSNPSLHLLVAGDGWYRDALESRVRELKLEAHVHLLGMVHDVPALLQAADLFVFPSHYEGHPGALVEAMFAARPIVASDIPVHRECITPGESGLLVPLGDPTALAQAIVWMLDHPEEAREMGRQARAVALERFHIDRIAAQHEELYARVLADWQARRSP